MRKHTRARAAGLVAIAAVLAAVVAGSPDTAAGATAGQTARHVPAGAAEAAPDAQLFTNPVLGPGQDPSVVVSGGAWYIYTTADNGNNERNRQCRVRIGFAGTS